MRELPDLSLVVGKQLGFGEPDQTANADLPDLGDPNVTESDVEAQLVRKKSGKKKKREETAASEEKQPEETSAGGDSGPEKKRDGRERIPSRFDLPLWRKGNSKPWSRVAVPKTMLSRILLLVATEQRMAKRLLRRRRKRRSQRRARRRGPANPRSRRRRQMRSKEPQKFRLLLLLLKRQQRATMKEDRANRPRELRRRRESCRRTFRGFVRIKSTSSTSAILPLFVATRSALALSARFEGVPIISRS